MKILFEDNHLIAVLKPNGVLSQGDITGDKSIMDDVKAYLKKKYKKPGDVFLGSIHRLDRVTSGLILFARTTKALTRMNKLMKERKINKSYIAILDERPDLPMGKLTHYLRKNHKANYVVVSDTDKPETKKAVLNYELLANIENTCLVKVNIETGRPHQIRAQFSHIGAPIAGDTKYNGSKQDSYKKGIFLHAYSLDFIHPVKKEKVRITCSPPDKSKWKEYSDFVKTLR
jgi:23S rRNA pseudouridine1911/1915/1917 synthase